MREISDLLMTYLKTLHPNVFLLKATDKAVTPYLVVDFPNPLDDGEGRMLITVDIDGWDKAQDTTVLEALMKKVNDGLNKRTLTDGTTTVVFYLDTPLSLTDDDSRISRRDRKSVV